ncbi:hypothetical protein ACRAQ7_04795 [Erythrobacter sp. W53]|uniref:hypothetical protein n=1 Tax=Erythrobacter sp. W53 TaxID=3425947 RepID=UPI003D766DE9
MRGVCTLALALIVSAWAVPAASHAQESSIRALQKLDAQLFSVGWKLVTGNAPYCKNAAPAIGLMLHDAHSYGEPEKVREELGLTGDIGVQAVAPWSPAAQAGVPIDATITHLDAATVTATFPPSDPLWQRLTRINDTVDRSLAENGQVAVIWKTRDGGETVALLPGVAACPTRFEVLSKGGRAVADGKRVILGRKFVGFSYDEPEFAAVVAHELAHNLLGHRALLDELGRKRKFIRLTERDADRLMPWLLANAGYNPQAAARFMKLWGPKHSGGIFRKRTHDGWNERLEYIEAEIALVEETIARTGRADWSQEFVQSTDGYSRDQ